MKRDEPMGVLPVIKPAGPTSHDVVQIARRALHQRAIGHTGTLDPAADGLLLLCAGPYTKLVPYLIESDKTYKGQIGFGIETTTDDREGAPTLVGDTAAVTTESVRALLGRYIGDIKQIPPKYAAVKIDGKKLYEYARENVEVKVEPRPVSVFSFTVGELREVPAPATILDRGEADAPRPATILMADFEARVSSGTYVRALARDLGRDLGCGGYLAGLTRTAIGRYHLDDAIELEELRQSPDLFEDYVVRGIDSLDPDRYRALTLLKAYEERLFRGQPLHDKMLEDPAAAEDLPSGAIVGMASESGSLLAVMQAERFEGQLKENPYGSRYMVHFKALKVFPRGLN